MKQWKTSSTPYFPVISDFSHVKDNTLAPSRTSYPEVRYVFVDDPLYFELENGIDDEEAIVLDLDAQGQSVTGYKCLNDDIGLLSVNMKDKEGTKTVEIDITRSQLEGVEQLKPVKDVGELRKLVLLYRERSAQLEKVLRD